MQCSPQSEMRAAAVHFMMLPRLPADSLPIPLPHPPLHCTPLCLQVIRSPMPGTLVHLAVEVGQEVHPGDEVRACSRHGWHGMQWRHSLQCCGSWCDS